jgi:hypothetical protein
VLHRPLALFKQQYAGQKVNSDHHLGGSEVARLVGLVVSDTVPKKL